MKEEDVRTLADEILRPILGPVGFLSSNVEVKPDHDGDESLFLTVHFKSGSQVASGKIYSNALVAIKNALEQRGEQRFPYFNYDYPEDDLYLEEDEEEQVP